MLPVPIFVNIVLLIRNASRSELVRASNRSQMSYWRSFISPWKIRLTGVVNEIAAEEVTPELVRGVHDGEAAGCRIDDEIAGLGSGADQPSDEANWLDMRMNLPIDFLPPATRNAVIAPRGFGAQPRLLQHEQIIAAPPRAVAIADALAVPCDEVNTFEYIGNP